MGATNTAELLDDEKFYEIIDGQRVQMPPLGIFAALIASNLLQYLGEFIYSHKMGWMIAHALFDLPLPEDRSRRRDLAFVSNDRWARNRPVPDDESWNALPNLVVEVVNRNELAEEVQQKVNEYFLAGVTLVWVVFPLLQQVYVYESPTSVRILTRTDELDGGTVLPGFRLPLTELFPESASENGAPTQA